MSGTDLPTFVNKISDGNGEVVKGLAKHVDSTVKVHKACCKYASDNSSQLPPIPTATVSKKKSQLTFTAVSDQSLKTNLIDSGIDKKRINASKGTVTVNL